MEVLLFPLRLFSIAPLGNERDIMIIRHIVATISALLLVGQVHATRTGYDVQQNLLTVPSLQIDGVRYNFPKVRILSVEVVDTGIISQAPAALHICVPGADAITQSKLDLIKIGMTLDDVNQIMGCQYNPPFNSINDSCANCPDHSFEIFNWGFGMSNVISVNIDNTTRRVVNKSSGMFTP